MPDDSQAARQRELAALLDQITALEAKFGARAATPHAMPQQSMEAMRQSMERLPQDQQARIARLDARIARLDARRPRQDRDEDNRRDA